MRAMEQRLSWASRIEAETIDKHLDEWNETIEEIANDPRYHGLKISYQIGLVPIGRDPSTKLLSSRMRARVPSPCAEGWKTRVDGSDRAQPPGGERVSSSFRRLSASIALSVS
jgi:hypothetical protein